MNIFLALQSCLFLFLVLLLHTSSLYSQKTYFANKGVLDLSKWQPRKQVTLDLQGDWEFFWQHYCHPHKALGSQKASSICSKEMRNGFRPTTYWNDFVYQGKEVGSYGYATFRLQIHLPKVTAPLGIKFLTTNSAFCAYANKHLLYCSGKPGTSKASTRAHNQIAFVEIPTEIQEKNNFFLTIHMANFHHSRGGFNEKFIIGDLAYLQKAEKRNLVTSTFIIGGLFFMSLYHFGLFFSLKNVTALYLALYCIQAIIFQLCTNDTYLTQLFASYSYNFAVTIEYFVQYTGVTTFVLFIYSLFKEESSYYVFCFTIYSTLALGLFVLCTPPKVFTRTLNFGNFVTIVAIMHSIYAIFKALFKKKKEAQITIIGFIIFFLCVINDISFSYQINTFGYLMPYGTFFFLFFQS
ncbi:MAG: 7TM-DISM domain-containing protein, partial [Spirochaetota bacterium]